MIKKLPIPYVTDNNNVYREIELKKPSGKILADTREAIDNTNYYNAMRIFAAGCCERIIGDSEITDSVSIKGAIAKISNKSAEYICAQVMIEYYKEDDYVEGLYICPRCDFKVLAEKKEEDGIVIDTRDRISDLKVNFMENLEELEFDVDLNETISLKSKSIAEEVSMLTMRFPIVEDYIKAFHSLGDSNSFKIQYYVYGQCILKVDNVEVDDTWRRAYGALIFNKIVNTKEVFRSIGNKINQYGIDPRVEKFCKNCHKKWKAQISSVNFFDSALQ